MTPEQLAHFRAMGRKRGLRKAANRRAAKLAAAPPPFAGNILDAMDLAGLTGASWDAWHALWRAVFDLPMTPADLERFRRHTGRTVPPSEPVREGWLIVGRRGGKTRSAALAALWLGIRRDYTALLAPGERGVVALIAAD